MEKNRNAFVCKMILGNGFDPDPRVYKEATSLAEAGYSVEILCWDREGKHILTEQNYPEGFSVRRFVFSSQYGSGMKQLGAFLSFKKAVRQYLKDRPVDLIHCHDLDALIVGVGTKQKAPLIFDEHDILASYFRLRGGVKNHALAFLLATLQKWLMRKINRHIVVTPRMRNLYGGQADVITNAPLRSAFVDFADKAIDPKAYVIGYVGHVRYYEEHIKIIDMIRDIPNLKYFLAGGGTRQKDIQAFVEEKQISNTEILGPFQAAQIAELYGRFDITHLIYPGEASEISMPNKFFESVVTGKPILCNEGSEISELVKKNGFGWVVSSDEELKSLLHLISSGEAHIEAIKERLASCREAYFWDSNAQKLINIYDSILCI